MGVLEDVQRISKDVRRAPIQLPPPANSPESQEESFTLAPAQLAGHGSHRSRKESRRIPSCFDAQI